VAWSGLFSAGKGGYFQGKEGVTPWAVSPGQPVRTTNSASSGCDCVDSRSSSCPERRWTRFAASCVTAVRAGLVKLFLSQCWLVPSRGWCLCCAEFKLQSDHPPTVRWAAEWISTSAPYEKLENWVKR